MDAHADLNGNNAEESARAKSNWKKIKITVKAADRFERGLIGKLNKRMGFVKDRKHQDPYYKMVNIPKI
jgi:hypothetical protein